MTTLTKVTCSRCGGSGSYSFNHRDGTKCYGCDGTGFQMVDLKKVAAKKLASEKRAAIQEANRERTITCTNVVITELNALFDNQFDVTTQLGVDQLNKAVCGKFNKTIWIIRNERLMETK